MRYLIVKLEPKHYGQAFYRVRLRRFFFGSWLKDATGRVSEFETRVDANAQIQKLLQSEVRGGVEQPG